MPSPLAPTARPWSPAGRAASAAPDGNRFRTVGGDVTCQAQLWETATGQLAWAAGKSVPLLHTGVLSGAGAPFSCDGRLLFLPDGEGTAGQLFDVGTGKAS